MRRRIEVTPQAEAGYTEHVHDEMTRTVWHNGGCNSWYKSRSGRVVAMFPGFTFMFRRMARNFKREDHVIAAARARGFSPADDNEADAIAILLWALETKGGLQ